MKKVKCVASEYWEDLTVGNSYELINSSEYCFEVKDDSGDSSWYFKSSFEDIKDTIVHSVIQQFEKRSNIGIEKYGVTMDRDDLSVLEWLQHLQEELMDATLYIEKLKQEHE